MDEQIQDNYKKICENMMEYINTNTGPDETYEGYDIIIRGALTFNLIEFINCLITDLPILDRTFGGSTVTYNLGDNPEEYQPNKLKNKTFLPNAIDEIDPSKRNIIIIGGSINGLYMSILLRIFIPHINIIIITDNEHSRQLSRDRPIAKSFTKMAIELDDESKETFDGFISNCNGTVDKSLFLKENKLSLLPDEIISCFAKFNAKTDKPIQINIIEYCLANYTQQLGSYILFKERSESKDAEIENISSYITEQTLMIFDATGGRLDTIMKYNWTDPNDKYRDTYERKGYNQTPFATFSHKPCMAIGDSLYQGNFIEGNSVVISFCICFILSLVLSKILEPTMPEEEREVVHKANGHALDGGLKRQRKTKRRKYKLKKRSKSKRRRSITSSSSYTLTMKSPYHR